MPRNRLNPKSFLSQLGIQDSKHVRDDESYYRALKDAGANLEDRSLVGSFAPEYQQVLFATPQIARWTLCRDYKRFLWLLQESLQLKGLPQRPRRILDLGGGPGVIGIWYAKRFPHAQIVVVDHGKEPLEYGQSLAEKVRASNVQFKNLSYENVVDGNLGEFDILLFHHAIDFSLSEQIGAHALAEVYSDEMEVDSEAVAACRAIATCLAEGGAAVVNFNSPYFHVPVHFFEAARRAGLGVDWRGTKAKHKIDKDGQFAIDDWTLMLRKGIPHLLQDSLRDTYSLLTLGRYFGDPWVLGVAGESLSQLADDITPGFRFRARYVNQPGEAQPEERIQLTLANGLGLYEHTSTRGFNRTLLSSAASAFEFLGMATDWRHHIMNSPNASLVEDYCSDVLQDLIQYYQEIDAQIA